MHFIANLSLLFPESTPFAERCARVAAQGFKQVELLFPYEDPISSYRQALQDYGLEVVLINTPIHSGQFGFAALTGHEERFKYDFDQAVNRALDLEAKAIHLMAGQPVNNPLWHNTLTQNLYWALDQIKGMELTLQLEALNRQDIPHYAYWSALQVLPILQEFNHSQLRLQFDFYHTLNEQLPLTEILATVYPWVSHVQLANPFGRNEPNLHAFPETITALQYLQDQSYNGFIGCEYKPTNQFESSLGFLDQLSQLGLCTTPRRHKCM